MLVPMHMDCMGLQGTYLGFYDPKGISNCTGEWIIREITVLSQCTLFFLLDPLQEDQFYSMYRNLPGKRHPVKASIYALNILAFTVLLQVPGGLKYSQCDLAIHFSIFVVLHLTFHRLEPL